MIELSQHSKMRGLFKIEKHQVDDAGKEVPGSREVVAPWQDNMVLDSGLDNMVSPGFMARCHVGAGNTPPSASDTVLQSPVNWAGGNVEAGPVGDDYVSIVGTYTFSQGSAAGILAEIGVGPTSGLLTTRSLIRDDMGDPTTIVVGPLDVLTVTYMLREYPEQTQTVSQVTNPHTSVTYTVTQSTWNGLGSNRLLAWNTVGAVNVGDSSARGGLDSNPLVPWDSTGAGTSGRLIASSKTLESYVPGSHYRDVVFTFNEASGNVPGGASRLTQGNTSAASWTDPFYLQASFDPPIDKDNTKTLIIKTRKSWGRM